MRKGGRCNGASHHRIIFTVLQQKLLLELVTLSKLLSPSAAVPLNIFFSSYEKRLHMTPAS